MIENKQSKHFYWLDLIRFGAAFFVLLLHYRGAFFEEYSLLPASQQNVISFAFYSVTRLGAEAVLIFFVLSGFLVGGRGLMSIKNGSFNMTKYVVDRTVRIGLPLISAILLGYIIYNHVIDTPVAISVWIMNLFSLQGLFCEPAITPLWSLSYEVWFYILFGAVAFILTKRDSRYLLLAEFVFVLCLAAFCQFSVRYLFIWIIGAIAYTSIPKIENRSKAILIISFIIGLIVLCLIQISTKSHFAQFYIPFVLRKILEVLLGFCAALFIQQVVLFIPTSKFVLNLNKIGTRLAAFSYTLYLTHEPILCLLRYLGFPKSPELSITAFAWFFLELAIALTSAYLIYLVFERNTAKVKSFIFSLLKS